MNFNETLTIKVQNIEEIIKKFLPKEEGYQKTILEAMNYSILAGGKRLRPMLMQEVFNMSCLAEEHLYVIAINNKCRVLGISLVSSGSNTQTFCCSNSIYTRALLLGATGVVVVHNHVSGDPSPSKDDKKCLDKLRQAGLIVDVALQDFIIVGDGVYYSAKEQGDLE